MPVQLVAPAVQVPVPPSICALPTVCAPSQNCTLLPGADTTTLTCCANAVCKANWVGSTEPGMVPKVRPLSVSPPV